MGERGCQEIFLSFANSITLRGSWFSLYSSGTSSNKSDTDTPRAFASRSRVVVFTPLKGSLHILFTVKKDTSDALDKLDMLNPLDSAISFTLRRIILLPFGSMVCQLYQGEVIEGINEIMLTYLY